jgi:hypothetical protein
MPAFSRPAWMAAFMSEKLVVTIDRLKAEARQIAISE